MEKKEEKCSICMKNPAEWYVEISRPPTNDGKLWDDVYFCPDCATTNNLAERTNKYTNYTNLNDGVLHNWSAYRINTYEQKPANK
ncbi:MAG: hypothetical protein ACP5IJ_00835 [Candidatus Nanoarchaeia archaeon]